MKVWILLLPVIICFSAGAQEKSGSECEQRDVSVSIEECKARLALAKVAPLAECKGKDGEDYRKCAVKVPSKVMPPAPSVQKVDPYAGMTEQQKAAAVLCDHLHANGGSCFEEREARMAKLQKDIDDAAASLHEAERAEEKQVDCVQSLRIGDSIKKVRACGVPIGINGDLADGTAQWVFPHRNYVYVRNGLVRNVQWSTGD